MTPLARSLVIGDLEHDAPKEFVDAMFEAQFFDVTLIADMLNDMAWDISYGKAQFSAEDLFLPSEPCVIEWCLCGQRHLFLLQRHGAEIVGSGLFGYVKQHGTYICERHIFTELRKGPLFHPIMLWNIEGDSDDGAPSFARFEIQEKVFLALAIGMINTPRIVGRRQHMPTAKLEKMLLSHHVNTGRFPLGAWSEIVLRITPPKDESGKSSREAHLTGTRAMHFCRAHLRLRQGRVEVVRGHWRGDASLGIKRHRYKVVS